MNNPIVIGVGGFARAGKDTFVKVAAKILKENGYTSQKLAFADALKKEIGPFIQEFYGINVWTDNTEEKTVIRPLLVAHGCQKRLQTGGKYWVNKVDEQIEEIINARDISKHIIFVSDCRFPNEVDWVHNTWQGWFLHLKKYSVKDLVYYAEQLNLSWNRVENKNKKVYDEAPNDEEAKNDPICEKNADFRLELENVMERELRINNIKITPDSVADNTYLSDEIKLCLTKCPFLIIR